MRPHLTASSFKVFPEINGKVFRDVISRPYIEKNSLFFAMKFLCR
jgi:hypothetical protein